MELNHLTRLDAKDAILLGMQWVCPAFQSSLVFIPLSCHASVVPT